MWQSAMKLNHPGTSAGNGTNGGGTRGWTSPHAQSRLTSPARQGSEPDSVSLGAHPPLNRSLGGGGAVAAVPAPAHPGAGLP